MEKIEKKKTIKATKNTADKNNNLNKNTSDNKNIIKKTVNDKNIKKNNDTTKKSNIKNSITNIKNASVKDTDIENTVQSTDKNIINSDLQNQKDQQNPPTLSYQSPPKTSTIKESCYKVNVQENAKKDEQRKESLKSDLKFMAVFLFFFTIIRCFIYDYYMIPSSSMVPGLLIGDMPLTRKWTYGYSKHSMWFSPELWSGRICQNNYIKRGEVIVFKDPSDSETNIIKRVIGLPGDTISVNDGVICVNGENAKLKYKSEYIYTDERNNLISKFNLYEETLPLSNILHDVIYDPTYSNLPHNNMQQMTVPDGHYFVMGDNRDRSKDSRCGLGLVPDLNVMGQAERVIYSIDNGVKLWEFWRWLPNIRYERIWKKVV